MVPAAPFLRMEREYGLNQRRCREIPFRYRHALRRVQVRRTHRTGSGRDDEEDLGGRRRLCDRSCQPSQRQWLTSRRRGSTVSRKPRRRSWRRSNGSSATRCGSSFRSRCWCSALLAYCIVKFRASANPIPSRTSHNTLIEVIWTIGPVVVLLAIAVPSFQLLTAQYTPPEDAKLTVKATGNQWNWDYEYQIEDPLSFNSAMLAGRRPGRPARKIAASIRGSWPSTTRWSFRSTRWCASW